MMVIVPLSTRHCEAVAHLHLNYLGSHFRGIAGQRLLRAYYATVAEGQGACGYVAEDQGRIVGYGCGVWEPAMVRTALLEKHWFEVIVWSMAQVIIDLGLIALFVDRLRELVSGSVAGPTGYELRPIVVIPAVRGTGIASKLVTRLLADAGQRGFQYIHLFAELDNKAAKALYHKLGFQPTSVSSRSGIAYVGYERSVL